jgi:hypothetical protein
VETSWSDALSTSQGDVPPLILADEEGMIREHRQRLVSASPGGVPVIGRNPSSPSLLRTTRRVEIQGAGAGAVVAREPWRRLQARLLRASTDRAPAWTSAPRSGPSVSHQRGKPPPNDWAGKMR